MEKIYHVLNGDALYERFPEEISGDCIIFRECLVEGPVEAKDLSDFQEVRARFLDFPDGDDSRNYSSYVIPELNKLQAIEEGAEVNLWFEDDLFCQVNLWFIIHLLKEKQLSLFLVHPDHLSPYGFAAYDQGGIQSLLKKKIPLNSAKHWVELWPSYTSNDLHTLKSVAQRLTAFPFVAEAALAHLDRFPSDGLGRPERALLKIMEDLDQKDFGPVFREFSKREPIYGFGDLQVQRMFDKLVMK